MAFNQNSGYGAALLASIQNKVPAIGNIFMVMNSADTDEKNYQHMQDLFPPDTDGNQRFFTSFADAYAAAESNNNDVILLDANSTHSLSAGIDWAKNRIHVFGLDWGRRLVQQGAKVELAAAATTAYVIKVTGVRNTFTNVKFIQSGTAATCLNVLQEWGEGSLYDHCSFVFGVVDNLDLTTAHEILAGSDSATYIDCTFGCDTLLTSAARSVFHIDQVNGFEFKSNRIRGCTFLISSSSSTATFVRLDAVGDILFTNLFEHCVFYASVDSAGGAAIAEASQTGTSTVKGTLAYHYCSVFNCTDFSTATSGRNAATQVVASVPTAGTAGIGVAPTA